MELDTRATADEAETTGECYGNPGWAILILDVCKGCGPKLAAGYLLRKHETLHGKAEASGHITCCEASSLHSGRVAWKAGAGAHQQARRCGQLKEYRRPIKFDTGKAGRPPADSFNSVDGCGV